MIKFILWNILLCFPALAGAQGVSVLKDTTMQKNKTLHVKEVSFDTETPSLKKVDSVFNASQIEWNAIDVENWNGYSYRPDVKFRMAYTPKEIYLQYHVKESCIKADYGSDSGSRPYTDSCLEFFCIPAEDDVYYNLELNCIAKGTFAGGAKRAERTRFGDPVLSQIRRESTLGPEPFGTKISDEKPFEYTITVALPVELFSLSEVKSLKGRTIRGNFYKCGDDMPQPHYLSWNPIGTPRPNFHTPEYFGFIHFE